MDLKKRFFCIILSLVLGMTSYGTVLAEEDKTSEEQQISLNLHASQYAVMDMENGRLLFGKDSDAFHPMASTTKIMTAILALELGNPEDVVTAGTNAAKAPEVHIGVRKGEQYYLKDLIYSMLLESHNDSAVMIAEHLAGDMRSFAAIMNQKARDIGCVNTNFVTPNGLDAVSHKNDQIIYEHGTTASDLTRIMRYCTKLSEKKDVFMAIAQTNNYTFCDRENRRTVSCINHNALLTMREGVLAGKTGFTGGAGFCYVTAVKTGEEEIAIALLGCGWPPHKSWKWQDVRQIIDFCKKEYQRKKISIQKKEWKIPVEQGKSASIDDIAYVHAALEKMDGGDWSVLLHKNEKADVVSRLPKKLKAPVTKGELIGEVQYRINGTCIREVPIIAQESIEKKDAVWAFQKIMDTFCCPNFMIVL